MLVSLFRTGPLRHVVAKGYLVRGTDPARLLAALSARPPALPAAMTVRVRPDRATLWIDSGPVWLLDPTRRNALVGALAESTALLAEQVARLGGELLPNGWAPASDGPGWLCPDLHAVEVASDVQRELCTNLLRRHMPELIALTGRAAFGPDHVEPTGSRRLAEATDHVPTRYLDSASRAHIGRVQESLRRDHGVARLEHMDVNPLGGPTEDLPTVEVRGVDGQLLPRMAVAHAVLVQALAMSARRMEQEGRRVRLIPGDVLDRNRSRAIAAGLAARFDPDPPDQRPGRRGEARPAPPRRTAAERLVALVEQLIPELAAMQVEATELATLVAGPSIAATQPRAVCTENDLLRVAPIGSQLQRRLRDRPGWRRTM